MVISLLIALCLHFSTLTILSQATRNWFDPSSRFLKSCVLHVLGRVKTQLPSPSSATQAQLPRNSLLQAHNYRSCRRSSMRNFVRNCRATCVDRMRNLSGKSLSWESCALVAQKLSRRVHLNFGRCHPNGRAVSEHHPILYIQE